ncbi:hypothetical protein [Variovorax terrae]|uniref:Uncharacterized protein n=1 Tax=Variovorax terrae TaxID=2923278 RepID=A0A9X2APU4_9BURK|nr:hypothetical protein [Variovorax terrae]MCJ0762426.1 hypothetical protein [Variovorax terrae]
MNPQNLSAAATQLIDTFGSTAHQVITAYRHGGERLADALEQRWKRALKESSPQLTPEVRKNAAHAQQVFSGYYARGLALSADGAETVVDTLVGAAKIAAERASAFAQAGLRKTA